MQWPLCRVLVKYFLVHYPGYTHRMRYADAGMLMQLWLISAITPSNLIKIFKKSTITCTLLLWEMIRENDDLILSSCKSWFKWLIDSLRRRNYSYFSFRYFACISARRNYVMCECCYSAYRIQKLSLVEGAFHRTERVINLNFRYIA